MRYKTIILLIFSILYGHISYSQPIRLASYSLSATPYDFAITPDGSYAVVQASQNEVLLTIVYALQAAVQVAAFDTILQQPISAKGAVETTNERAVVLGGAGSSSIQVINLMESPPEILATFNSNYTPHDMAITPDARIAVVHSTQNENHRTTIYDLALGLQVAAFDATSAGLISAINSVEATNTRSILLGGAGATSVGIINIGAQIPFPMASFSLNAAPYDVAITPNGTYAVVRSFQGNYSQTTIYNLLSATQIASFVTSSSEPVSAVDAIGITDDRAVVLGGAGLGSVEIYDLADSLPTKIGSFSLNQTPHDVAITPDGLTAVVRSNQNENQLTTIFDLISCTQEASFNSTSGAAMDAINSVEATNSRAIVLGGAGSSAVDIIDLITSPPEILASFSSNSTPHDLAVMPNGALAIVRSRQYENLTTTIYDLINATALGSFESASGQPLSAINSVETSDERTVTLGGAGSAAVEIYGSSQPCCDVAMVPDSYPINVPPGGAFGLTGVIGNPTDTSIVIDIWIGVRYSGSFYQIWNFANIPLNPGQFASSHLNQAIPNFAPAGIYDYVAYCGNKPEKCDSAIIQFSVSGTDTDGGYDKWGIEGGWKDESEISRDGSQTEGNLLVQVKPNPFNPSTDIAFSLPETNRINLGIYNLLGQKVATLLDGEADSGFHSVRWDASNEASGIFFFILRTSNSSISQKMILLK